MNMYEDEQRQAYDLLNSVIDSEEISNFIGTCSKSPGVDVALYSIFASHDMQKNMSIANGSYDSQKRMDSWHRSLMTAFAVGATIARSITKLEQSLWAE